MLNTDLLPRPFSYDRPRVEGYRPLISGRVTRISRRRRNAWRAEALVDGAAMTLSHHNTKAEAEDHLAGMIKAYAEVHYIRANLHNQKEDQTMRHGDKVMSTTTTN